MTERKLHCHWSYGIGSYSSFLRWPTREALEADLVGHPHRDDLTILQVHDLNCPETDRPHN